MFDLSAFRVAHPDCYVTESVEKMIRFRSVSEGYVILRLDDEGKPTSDIPRDVTSFRWQTSTKSTNSCGDDMWNVTFSPSLKRNPCFIGTIHNRDEMCAFDLSEEVRGYLVGISQNRVIVAPNGHIIPYDVGDLVIHPREFGLVPALPSQAA